MKGETIPTAGRWGRFPLFMAKIGTMPGSTILVKRARRFYKGQSLSFCKLENVMGICKGCTPRWQRGYVWMVESGRLFINL